MVEGAPVILTVNINPSLSLFNGSKGKFIAPIYLRFEITSYKLFSSACVDFNTHKTSKQIEVITESNTRAQLPVGSIFVKMNIHDDLDIRTVSENTFKSAIFEIPQKPPFLPDYLVVEFEEYSNRGGPSFFPNNNEMKNFVCIKPYTIELDKKYKEHRQKRTRTMFPLELAFVMTAFKGIGANHIRTEAKTKGMYEKNGVFLVAISRIRNPKHLLIRRSLAIRFRVTATTFKYICSRI